MKLDRFIERPVLSTVISILIVILGFIGLVSLPIEQYPDIAPPTIMVRASYSGANAETVLNSVIAPLEEQINGVEGMTYMTSAATNDGSASITVYFQQGADADMAQVNVQNRVSQASALLPAEVTRAGVQVMKRQSSNVIIFALTGDPERYDNQFIGNYADINIIPAIKRVKGVGECQAMGLQSYTMRLWLDPIKMKSHNLMPSDITGILAQQNIEAAPGKFGEQTDNQYEYTIRYKGRLKTPEEFQDMIITSDTNGQTVRIKDVAKVELGGLYYSFKQSVDGEPSIMMMVTQTAGSNATQIIKDVKEVLADAEKSLPPGVEIKIMQDVSEFLNASIDELIKTLFEAFVLVFIVVYIFLQDFRSTLIPLIAVPVSLVGTFFFLYAFGFSLNLLTLAALVLAIAIVVDDAIVVVEAVHAKLDLGYKSTLTASKDAMSEISGAIISITLVMAAVFVPVSFLGGTSGTFYREFGVTMAISIIISALNALTLSPALCAVLLKPHNEDGSERKMSMIDRFHVSFNAAYSKIQGKYQNGVRRIVERPLIAVGSVVVGIVAMALLMMNTRTGLVPDEDTGTLFVTVATPPGTSLEKTNGVMDQVDKMLKSNPGIQSTLRISGYSFIGGQGSNQGTFIVKLKSFEERNGAEGPLKYIGVHNLGSSMILGMIYKQTATIKGAQILAFQPPMIQGFSATNGLTFSMQDRTGGDVNKFFDITQKFLGELNKRPEVASAMTQYNSKYPQYMMDVDVAKCKQSGIDPSVVLSTMQGYFGGLYASNFNSYGKLYRVMIQASPEFRGDTKSLDNIYVRTGNGTMSPIGTYVNLTKMYAPQEIDRFNLFTSINVNASTAEGYSTGDVIKAMEEVAAQNLPEGYSYEFSGLTRSEQESSNSTAIIFVLCLTFVYLILSAQYESYILPLSVILSIPFGLAGAFIFTNLFGKQNDIYMQIALIMLIGLLAKNAILIVEFALERRRTGMAISWSAVLGAAARLRPILMTSLAMIIGLLPLLVPMGAGYNGNMTLGAAAIGGMLIGMLCQIMVVPALFYIFQVLQEKIKPIEFDDNNANVDSELRQYTNPYAAAELQKQIDKNVNKE
ncbi:efflux RND transporter permease subunit [Palleniella muris]|uniref:Efflux RND transporter permease subunit n=1 Tax=Palleniella muris TaxID=3038145 RepID=A0AC61QS54_9BACT|nr:efflux RND transporter permease subunit [Palleniella muris]TGX82872.1 efflux RND transporter permease subunit [Palleniella muris]